MSEVNFRAAKVKSSMRKGDMSVPPPQNPKNSKLRRKTAGRGEGSSQATSNMEIDDLGSQLVSPTGSTHIELLEAEGFGDRGKQRREEESEEEGGENYEDMTPYFLDSLLGITKRGRKKTVKQAMARFPSAKDIEVVEKDPTKAISSAFDGVLKAGMTLSVLAEKYRRGAMEDVEGLRAELSKARTEIHGLKEELNSARKTVKSAKKELADAQEAGTSRIQALETQLKEAKEEKEQIAKELKERKDELAQMKSDLAEA